MADAVVHVLSSIPLAAEYYQRCGLDVFGPGRISTGQTLMFGSFEELLDNMLKRTEVMQIVVCHGSPTEGLLMKFARGVGHDATGLMMPELSALAHDSIFFKLGRAHLPKDNPKVVEASRKMGVLPEAVVRIAEKILEMRSKKRIILIRGCNIGANKPMLADYKTAFGALAIFAPVCRMFFLRIRPHTPSRKKHETMSGLATGKPTTPKTRRRYFPQVSSNNISSPLIIDVRDINGHSQVDNEAFISARDVNNGWAKEFNGAWNGGLPNEFILPVMWDNDESSYYVPPELGYRMKFTVV